MAKTKGGMKNNTVSDLYTLALLKDPLPCFFNQRSIFPPEAGKSVVSKRAAGSLCIDLG
jgi:hypothetical protein